MTCRTEALTERPEVRRALGAIPPRGACGGSSRRRCPRRRSRRSRTGPGGPRATCTRCRAATRSSSPRCWRPRPTRRPGHVRDAVAVRVGALGPEARAVTEIAAVVPGSDRAAAAGGHGRPRARTPSTPASRAGILQVRDDAVVFRHDLARRAVEGEIGRCAPPRAGGRRAPRAGGGRRRRSRPAGAPRAPRGRQPWRSAGSPPSAARVGERRGQPPPGARALGGGARGGAGAEALEGVSVEGTCAASSERALEARRALLRAPRGGGRGARRVGDDLRWLSRILWWAGEGAEAAAAGDQAIAVLESLPGEP